MSTANAQLLQQVADPTASITLSQMQCIESAAACHPLAAKVRADRLGCVAVGQHPLAVADGGSAQSVLREDPCHCCGLVGHDQGQVSLLAGSSQSRMHACRAPEASGQHRCARTPAACWCAECMCPCAMCMWNRHVRLVCHNAAYARWPSVGRADIAGLPVTSRLN